MVVEASECHCDVLLYLASVNVVYVINHSVYSKFGNICGMF